MAENDGCVWLQEIMSSLGRSQQEKGLAECEVEHF